MHSGADAQTCPADARHSPGDALLGLAAPRRAGSALGCITATRMAGSNRDPCKDSKRTYTHQFFVHFCFDVSGESEKCLWNKHVVSALEQGADRGLLVPGHRCLDVVGPWGGQGGQC